MKKLLLSCLIFLGMVLNAQITLGSGTTTGRLPVDSYYGYTYSQQIIKKSEINADAAGNITGLTFYLSATATLTNTADWVVYLGLTPKTQFDNSADWIPVSSLTQVFAGTVTNNAGQVNITFATPFAYDNSSNLVIACDENTPSYNGLSDRFYNYTAGPNMALAAINDFSNTDPNSPPTGAILTTRSVVTLNGLTPSANPTCPAVITPADGSTTFAVDGAITWNAVSNATGYKISLGTTPGGTDILNNVDAGNTTSYNLSTPLQYSTNYYLTVNSYNATASSVGCSEISFMTKQMDCPVVSSPANGATQVSTTPTISWSPIAGATGYHLTVGTTSGGNDVLNNFDLGNVTSYTFPTALANGAQYYYTLTAYNANTESSGCGEKSFSTICSPTTAFTQNFDGVSSGQWPTCWGKVGSGGSAYPTLSTAMSAPNALYIYSGSGSSMAVVTMPPVSTLQSGTYRLKFDGRANFTAGGVVQVGYLTNPQDDTTFVVLGTYTSTSTSTIDHFVLNNITAPAGVTTLAFRHTGSPAYSVLIDNVVYELMPSCVEPTNLVMSGATASSLSVSWTATTPAPANGYQYYYSTTNTAPDATTAPSGSVTGTTATISGLTPSTYYYIWVRSNCGGSTSTWVGPAIGYTGYCQPSAGTTSNTYYVNSIVTTGASPELNYSASSYTAIDAQASNTFGGYPSGNFDFTIGASAGTNYYYCWIDWNNDMDFDDAGETIMATTTYTGTATGTISVPSTQAPGTYHVRFANSYISAITPCGPNPYGNYVDATLVVGQPPACMAPTAVTVTNTDTTTATVSWTASANASSNGYDIYYSTTNTAPTANSIPQVVANAGTTAVIPNLTPGTVYYVWVRGNCGAGSTSTWTYQYATATTACVPATVPYTLDFENTTAPDLPVCTTQSNNGGNAWQVNNAPSTAFSTNALTYHYNSFSPADAWFFTQGITLTAGTQYTISYDYGNNSTSYTENLGVAYGTSATAAGMTNTLADHPGITGDTLTNNSVTFTPTTTGVYYFGFHAYSDADQFYLMVDNININTASLATAEVVKEKVMVYPNPFRDILNISDVKNVKTVMVSDASGRLVTTIESPRNQLDLSSLSSGMYMVTMINKDGSKTTVKVLKR